tara:strand:- start:804 stop:1289 length:486 start_codon:yes stop_codon:yes gene_type:complete
MHFKKNNINKTKNFIQGLRPFSSSLPHGLKKILKKGGYNFSTIVDNWRKMVGDEISSYCYPASVKFDKNLQEGILILNVAHGNELNAEYNKKIILDKINSFFGFKCITGIKLKIIKSEVKVEKKIHKSNNKNLNKKISNINNQNLKKKLNELLKAFSNKNE